MATKPEDMEIQEEREFDIDDETPVEEVEVDVDVEGEADPEPEVAAEPEPEPEQEEQPKPRKRYDERLAALARRAAEAEQRAEAAERARIEYEQRLAANESVQVGAMESALKAELGSVKKELIEAKTLGDYAAEVEATAKLTKLQADLSAIEAYKASQRPREEAPKADAPKPQAPQYAPETAAWMAANSWFSPSSDDYDEEMAIDARAFAQKLEARLKREGRANDIGSREYFQLIDEHLAQAYPDAFDAPAPKGKMPTMKADKSVAPVARQSAPVQSQPKKSVVKLTAEQRRIAEAVSPNLPPEKAWALYARNM